MKHWIFVVNIFWAVSAFSQLGFNNTYGFEQEQLTSSAFANVLLDGDTLVLFGTCHPPVTPSGQQALLFIKMDTLGNVLTYKYHLDPDAPSDEYAAGANYEIIKTSDGGYALTGVALMTNFGVFIKLTHSGEVEIYKKYNPSPSLQYQPRKILELASGFMLGGHKTLQNGDIQVFLMKVDKQGNFLWEKAYGQPGVVDVMNSLIKIDDNHYAIGAAKSKGLGEPPYNANDTWSKGWLIQVDSSGNIISTQESPINTQAGMSGLKRMPDGWLFAAIEFQILSEFEWGSRSKIVRTGEDISNVIWQRYVSSSTIAGNTTLGIEPTPEGDWVAIGQWIMPGPEPPNFGLGYQGGSTYKFTSNGDSLWARLDTAFWNPICGSENRLGGAAVLPSGSVFAAGYANSNCFPPTPRSYGWVLKISKDGCIDTLCETTDLLLEPHHPEIIVYPNPTSGELNIIGCDICEAEIYDAFGRMVQKKQTINQSLDLFKLADGSYWLKIINENSIKIEKIIKCR